MIVIKYVYDFSDLILPKSEYLLLKKFEKRSQKYDPLFENLLSVGMIDHNEYSISDLGDSFPVIGECSITEKGSCYLQYYFSNYVKDRFPIYISLLALIISIISLIIG